MTKTIGPHQIPSIVMQTLFKWRKIVEVEEVTEVAWSQLCRLKHDKPLVQIAERVSQIINSTKDATTKAVFIKVSAFCKSFLAMLNDGEVLGYALRFYNEHASCETIVKSMQDASQQVIDTLQLALVWRDPPIIDAFLRRLWYLYYFYYELGVELHCLHSRRFEIENWVT